MSSVPITTNVVSLDSAHGEVYSIQYYVIKLVSDFRQVSDFLRVLLFPPPIKLIATIYEILLKVKHRKTPPYNGPDDKLKSQ